MSSFTENVLSSIKHKDLRKALQLDEGSSPSQVGWIKQGLRNIPRAHEEIGSQTAYSGEKDKKPYQQTDVLRDFYMTIAQHGLNVAYIHADSELKPSDLPPGSYRPSVAGQKRKGGTCTHMLQFLLMLMAKAQVTK